MSRQRVADTKPEVCIRRLLFAAGVRYRKHYPVPGYSRRSIDIAFPGHRLAVFIDGCFWHGCSDHKSVPKTNGTWWATKVLENQRRDADTMAVLKSREWRVMRFWEHEAPNAVAMSIIHELNKMGRE